MKVLVSGATGYIGGRLVPRLLDAGVEVRCITRDPARLDLAPWRDRIEVVAADALDAATLPSALEGCDVAYYLIHAMEDATGDYVRRDRQAAVNFREAAAAGDLQRIIYLGGLGDDDGELSTHLESRHEVGRILAKGETAVTELRAAVIIGSGSVSFELIRHLTEVLPIMFRPRWLRTRCQPIGIRNVLEILVAILDEPGAEDRLYDIGGPDVLTYEEMMLTYAEVAELGKRWVVPFPVFNARLAPGVIGLVTPLDQATIRPLIESLRTDVVVEGPSPSGFEPEKLFDYRTSVRLALSR
ncbi:MAG: NAD(P)H-binding protein, partial [Acidimicrobiia bacterium]